ncbi:unnamed protein product [Parnassius mnemosyne]|uniref:Tc1-like transposase DDE domain-containing protein n=1 Tax=Parnassius mnemosyne TaxID=213953 RepID=A0AAV1K6V1_9NEOP
MLIMLTKLTTKLYVINARDETREPNNYGQKPPNEKKNVLEDHHQSARRQRTTPDDCACRDGKRQRQTNKHVPNCLLAFKSTKTTEYHEEMNFKKFKEWFITLLENLHEPHMIIMENAPYHSQKRTKLQHPQQSEGIEGNENMLKHKLVRLVKENKPRKPIYILEEIAEQHGHTVMHPNNTSPPITAKKMLTLLQNTCDNVTADDWRKVVEHTKKFILEDWE